MPCPMDEMRDWREDSHQQTTNRTFVRSYTRYPPIVFPPPCDGARARFFDPTGVPNATSKTDWIWPLVHSSFFDETSEGVCAMTTDPSKDDLMAVFETPRLVTLSRSKPSDVVLFTRVNPVIRWKEYFAEIRVELLRNHVFPDVCKPPTKFTSGATMCAMESSETTCGVMDSAVYVCFVTDFSFSTRVNATHVSRSYVISPKNETCGLTTNGVRLTDPFTVSVVVSDMLIGTLSTSSSIKTVVLNGDGFVGLSVVLGFLFSVCVRFIVSRPVAPVTKIGAW